MDLRMYVADVPAEGREIQPLCHVARLALAAAGAPANPDWSITLESTIPIASGLGSGAALSAAMVRAIFAHAGKAVAPEEVSALVLESEKFYHGTPSGIDNAVIALGKPIWFVKGKQPEVIEVGETRDATVQSEPLTLLIADSGVASPTRQVVEGVKLRWIAEPARYNFLFNEIGMLAEQARSALFKDNPDRLGRIFDRNHRLLVEMGVGSPETEALIHAAHSAGVYGAKISGAGKGGNVIALVRPRQVEHASEVLLSAGAKGVIRVELG
jgi:mevalonate kinase